MSNISFGVNILPKTSSVTIGNSEAPWKIHINQINGRNAETALLPTVTGSDNNKVLKVVNGIWTIAEAPSGLPAVTSADNNKILKVVDGTWAAAEGGGGGSADTTIITDDYDATSTYPDIGSYCVKDGDLYRSTSAITTAEAWNSSHWTATNVMDEFLTRCAIQPAAGVSF